MRFAFAGTPQFGAWVLGDLRDHGLRPTLVVSQPDRPAGRGRHPAPPPVVSTAVSLELEVLQTADINSAGVTDRLRAGGIDVLVVAAFGQLLKPALLDSLLCLNVHASVLPAYRGAAPIARAIMAGERETGVSIMRMSPGLDEGPVAATTRLSIGPADTAGELGRALALLGAQGIARALTALGDGTIVWEEQVGDATYAAKLSAADRRFEPSLGAGPLHDRVRALAPDTGCDAETGQGLRLKVWRTWPSAEPTPLSGEGEAGGDMRRGAGRCHVSGDRLLVDCGGDTLELLAVQPAGKRVMRTPEFVRGYRQRLGGHIGPPSAGEKEG